MQIKWYHITVLLALLAIIIVSKVKAARSKIENTLKGANPSDANVRAFLKVIRYAEGTSASDGYNYLFGSRPSNKVRFTDFSKHPNIHRPFGKTTSTAAGAYQILKGTWSEAKRGLGLTDFSPSSQDAAAVFLIKRRKALDLVKQGKFSDAIIKVNREWASLPFSPYGQPTKTMASLKKYYEQNGGNYA